MDNGGLVRLGNALVVAGLLMLAGAGLWELGFAPGSRVTLPEPVVLQRRSDTREVTPASLAMTPTQTESVDVVSVALVALPTLLPTPFLPEPVGEPTSSPPQLHVVLAVADAGDRADAAQQPAPGYAVRLSIPSIKLDTAVNQGGLVIDKGGNPTWETKPFVAVHYGDLTALVGARGNAVIAGHVVTLNEGNVFRNLYRVDLSDRIEVWDDQDREHDFFVVDVKLVPPTDMSAMSPTPDRTLTLITCGGTFDPVKREFSERLIVIAKGG